jgi:hypothetical protein
VHWSLGEQHQDGSTDVTASAAPAGAAAPSTAWDRAEAAGPETPAEPSAETGSEAGPERPVAAGVVAPDIVAEFTAGLPAMFV